MMKRARTWFLAVLGSLTLSAGEIPGEIAHYPMRDGRGTRVKEAHRRLAPGIVKHSAWIVRDKLPLLDFGGKKETAEAFVELPEIDFKGGFTIALWINAYRWQENWAGIVYRSDATYGLRGNAKSPGQLHFRVKDAEAQRGVDLNSKTILEHGRWYHVAAVFDPGKSMQLYLDGKLDNATTVRIPVDLAVDQQRLRLGGSGKKNHFAGTMTDLHLFGRALSAEEIAGLYESENRFKR